MENFYLPFFISWTSMFILVAFWTYLFIYSHYHSFKLPWGFGIVIVGLPLSGIGYAFQENQITVFSINLMLVVCLIGLSWNISNIRQQIYIESTREFLQLTGIGLLCGLLLGLLIILIGGAKYIEINSKYTSIALITSSIQTSLAEEFLFTGYFLGYLKKYKFNEIFAIIFQSLLFTMLHIPRYSSDFITIGIIFLLGIISGYSAWKSNKLFLSFVLHIVVNLIAVIWWLVKSM